MDIDVAKKNLKGVDIKAFFSGMSEQSDYIIERADEVNVSIETVLSELDKRMAEEKINCVTVDYEREYERQQEYIKKLYTENEQYRKALLGLCIKFLGDDE